MIKDGMNEEEKMKQTKKILLSFLCAVLFIIPFGVSVMASNEWKASVISYIPGGGSEIIDYNTPINKTTDADYASYRGAYTNAWLGASFRLVYSNQQHATTSANLSTSTSSGTLSYYNPKTGVNYVKGKSATIEPGNETKIFVIVKNY